MFKFDTRPTPTPEYAGDCKQCPSADRRATGGLAEQFGIHRQSERRRLDRVAVAPPVRRTNDRRLKGWRCASGSMPRDARGTRCATWSHLSSSGCARRTALVRDSGAGSRRSRGGRAQGRARLPGARHRGRRGGIRSTPADQSASDRARRHDDAAVHRCGQPCARARGHVREVPRACVPRRHADREDRLPGDRERNRLLSRHEARFVGVQHR